MSVLSISRRIRSCSAAVSTLAIMHVSKDGSEIEQRRSERSELGCSVRHPGGIGGWFDVLYGVAPVSGASWLEKVSIDTNGISNFVAKVKE